MIWSSAPKVLWVGRARTLALCLLAMLVAASLGELLTAKPVHADTITVNTNQDIPTPPGKTTLRDAIDQANKSSEADTIIFDLSAQDRTQRYSRSTSSTLIA